MGKVTAFTGQRQTGKTTKLINSAVQTLLNNGRPMVFVRDRVSGKSFRERLQQICGAHAQRVKIMIAKEYTSGSTHYYVPADLVKGATLIIDDACRSIVNTAYDYAISNDADVFVAIDVGIRRGPSVIYIEEEHRPRKKYNEVD